MLRNVQENAVAVLDVFLIFQQCDTKLTTISSTIFGSGVKYWDVSGCDAQTGTRLIASETED